MSKESSIKVFAENASGTRPANAIPVWVDNISAIGGGASEEQINELSAAISAVSSNVANGVVEYSYKPSANPIRAVNNDLVNVKQIVDNGSNFLIVPNSILQVPNVITAYPGGLTAAKFRADDYGLDLSGNSVKFSANQQGLITSSHNTQFSAGIYGLYNSGYNYELSASEGGISLSSRDIQFSAGKNGLYNKVQYNPGLFISGQNGKIDINLTGGSAVDSFGYKKWQIGEADHLWSFAGGNTAYTALPIVLCYAQQAGSANAPYFMAGPGGITSEYKQNNGTMGLYGDFGQGIRYTNTTNKVSATLDGYDVKWKKYNDSTSANDVWSLTGSVQKRELEFDGTSTITGIAGSAIGGGSIPVSNSGDLYKVEFDGVDLYGYKNTTEIPNFVYSAVSSQESNSIQHTPYPKWNNNTIMDLQNWSAFDIISVSSNGNGISPVHYPGITALDVYYQAKYVFDYNENQLPDFSGYVGQITLDNLFVSSYFDKPSYYDNVARCNQFRLWFSGNGNEGQLSNNHYICSVGNEVQSGTNTFEGISVPQIQFVATSAAATGKNILYVVTGSN